MVILQLDQVFLLDLFHILEQFVQCDTRCDKDDREDTKSGLVSE